MSKIALITDKDLIFYYTGLAVDDGAVVINGDSVVLFTDKRYYESAKALNGVTALLLSEVSVVDYLTKIGAKEVGVIYSLTPYSEVKNLLDNNFSLYDYENAHYQTAMVKSAEELSKLQTASQITEKAFLSVLPHLKEGVLESEISALLEYNFKKFGGDGASFETIVAFGSGSAVPHYKTGGVPLKRNSVILMDFGATYQGYKADMTRTLYFGSPSETFINRYNAVLSAHELSAKTIKAGMTGAEIDGAVRKHLEKFGLDKNFTHSLGHGVGVKIHELPRLSKTCDIPLSDGMAFTIEPGVYFEGEEGIRIEDTYRLENGIAVSFMQTDKKLIIIQ